MWLEVELWLGIDPMLDQCWCTVYDFGLALKQNLINVSWLLRCRECWKVQWWDWPICDWSWNDHLVWPSLPTMMCLRSRMDALRMACTAMASDATKTKGYNCKGHIYYCKILYRYHKRIAFESETCADFPQLSVQFFKLHWHSLILN